MKKLVVILISALVSRPIGLQAEELAHARMHCLSVRFDYGWGPTGMERLDLTTLSDGINGELAPWYGPYSHWSKFELFDQIWGRRDYGVLLLNTPQFTDANDNGLDDFFEVSQPVSATSTGSWRFLGETNYHRLTATWTRAAGSPNGECVLELEGRGGFTHQFNLLEFTGAVVYAPGSNVVTGTIALVQTGATNNTLEGPVSFTKVDPDRFNRLELQSGTWINAQADSFVYLSGLICRLQAWPTNYCGFVTFTDGDPSTPDQADYWWWLLAIEDPTDSDGNGIPDFSDAPVLVPPRPPVLRLTLGKTNLLLEIHGDVGRLHEILEADSVTASSWLTNQVVVLTNDPHIVHLPIPSAPRFWRVRAF